MFVQVIMYLPDPEVWVCSAKVTPPRLESIIRVGEIRRRRIRFHGLLLSADKTFERFLVNLKKLSCDNGLSVIFEFSRNINTYFRAF